MSTRKPLTRRCQHDYPIVTRIADRPRSRRPNRRGGYVVDRFCDCLFCGPFQFAIEVRELDEQVQQPARRKGEACGITQ